MKNEYTYKTTCWICGKQFMARYNLGKKAKTCTPPTHKCKRSKKNGKTIVCVEKCCRSRYRASASQAAMDNAIDPRKVLSKTEFFEAIRKSEGLPEDRRVGIQFVAYTGCRLGEALLVRVKDILWQTGSFSIVKIPTLKRRDARPQRSVHIDNKSQFAKVLRAWAGRRPKESVLIPVHRRTLQRAAEEILKKVKPDRESLVHIFRHTRASRLIGSGARLNYVRQQLGWQSLELLKIYDHSEEDEIRDVLRKTNAR